MKKAFILAPLHPVFQTSTGLECGRPEHIKAYKKMLEQLGFTSTSLADSHYNDSREGAVLQLPSAERRLYEQALDEMMTCDVIVTTAGHQRTYLTTALARHISSHTDIPIRSMLEMKARVSLVTASPFIPGNTMELNTNTLNPFMT